jgi:hypothetical protein
VLVFQWGIADAVSVERGTATYHISYLFGMRSVTITVHSERVATADNTQVIELEVTANEQPWSTYTVSIFRHTDRTIIEYDYDSARRFGLRRIPQRMVATRFRDEALEAQGYTVETRTERIGLD